MPEGPEIRYNRERLLSKGHNIIGKEITNIKALSRKRVYIPKPSKIIDVYSKGKLLWIETQDYFVHIHFGLTGWLYLDDEPQYTKYIITLSNDKKIYVDSQRKFTKLRIYNKTSHNRIVNKLGIDILSPEFNLDIFMEKLRSKSTTITAFLLDQSIFSGVGNYIRNEALYMSKIHPKIITSKLDDKDVAKLYKAIRYVAYSGLITWLKDDKIKIPKDIKKMSPKKLQYPYKYRVYGKVKDPYGNKITLEKIGGRKTFYVKSRQKL